MKYIITEEQFRLLELNNSIRRRLHKGEEVINSLDPKDVRVYWKESEVFDYVRNLLDYMTLESIRDDDDYDKVYEYFSNKYEKYIMDFFYDSLLK